MKKLAAFLMILTAIAFCTESISVTVKGVSDIVGSRKDIACEKALEGAFRRAVEQAIRRLIYSETLVQNGYLISDKIYKQSTGYVKSYEIIDEAIDEKTQPYWIRIMAKVLKIDLENSIKELTTQIGTIRILFSLDTEPELVSAIKKRFIKQRNPSN